MAQRFWIPGGNGNWSSTTNWSTTSGGSSGASVPGSSDDAIYDANSGTIACSIDIAASCNNFDTSAVTNTNARITLFSNSSNSLTINGNCTLGTLAGGSNIFSAGGGSGVVTFAGTGSITSAGNSFRVSVNLGNPAVTFTGTYTLNDDLTIGVGGSQILTITGGTLTTNNHNVNCISLSTTGSPTLNLGTSIFAVSGYKGTILSFSTGTTITGSNPTFLLYGTNGGQQGQSFPSIIDLNGKSIGYLGLAYSVNFDDTYTNNQYWRFKTSGTIGQLDVPQGVFMKAVAGITLTVTNCNIVGSSTLPCSFISETGGSQFSLCVTNQNLAWTTFKDINFSCTAGNDPHGSCTSNCSNLTFNVPPAVVNGGASILTLM